MIFEVSLIGNNFCGGVLVRVGMQIWEYVVFRNHLTLTPTTLVICASVHVARFQALKQCYNQPSLIPFVVLIAFVAFIVFTVDIGVAFGVFVVTGIVAVMLFAVAAFVCLETNADMVTQIVTKRFIPTLYTAPALF